MASPEPRPLNLELRMASREPRPFDSRRDQSARRHRERCPFVLRAGRICDLLSERGPPLIVGIVTKDGVPAIEVEAGGERWQAIIDTGFNGELELPERLRSHMNAQFVGRVTALPATNQSVEEDVYLVDFYFDRKNVRVQATFVDGDEILIGTEMLQDYRLQIDFLAQAVTVEST
jgi:clan AA aspartic protease